MKRFIVLGIFFIVGIELLVLILYDCWFVFVGLGFVLVLVLFNVCWMLGNWDEFMVVLDFDDLGEGLCWWFFNIEMMIWWLEFI